MEYDYFPPRTGESDKPFYIQVNNSLDALNIQMANKQYNYETYVVDSATYFARNLILDAIPFTHAQGKGNKIGALQIPGPQDYNFEITGMGNLMAYLKNLPINIIVTAHIEDKWDKPKDPDTGDRLQYADNIIVGEKLALRPKVEAALSGTFDHIFRFDRTMSAGREQYWVEYISDLAVTSFPGLKPGKHNITGKSFREYTLSLVNNQSQNNQNGK